MVCTISAITLHLQSVVDPSINFACPCLSMEVPMVMFIVQVHVVPILVMPSLKNGLTILVEFE